VSVTAPGSGKKGERPTLEQFVLEGDPDLSAL